MMTDTDKAPLKSSEVTIDYLVEARVCGELKRIVWFDLHREKKAKRSGRFEEVTGRRRKYRFGPLQTLAWTTIT